MSPYLYRRLMHERLAQLRRRGDAGIRHTCCAYTSRGPTADADEHPHQPNRPWLATPLAQSRRAKSSDLIEIQASEPDFGHRGWTVDATIARANAGVFIAADAICGVA